MTEQITASEDSTQWAFTEFLKLHTDEELIRYAYRAQKAGHPWLSEILMAEIRDRTSK